MSDYDDALGDEPDDDEVELAREDREELVDDEDDEPQPWAKALPGDD